MYVVDVDAVPADVDDDDSDKDDDAHAVIVAEEDGSVESCDSCMCSGSYCTSWLTILLRLPAAALAVVRGAPRAIVVVVVVVADFRFTTYFDQSIWFAPGLLSF